MGLFSKKGICSICGKEKGTNYLVIDGYSCVDCMSKCSPFFSTVDGIRKYSVAELKEAMKLCERNMERISEFVTTNKVGDLISFDERHCWFKIGLEEKFLGHITYPIVYDYKDILGYELLEDGQSITKSGLGSAVVGGALFGEVGAIVGSVAGSKTTKQVVNSMKIKITLNDLNHPAEYIRLIETNTATDSGKYRGASIYAQSILSVLSIIVEKTKVSSAQNIGSETLSIAEGLREYKSLLDDGIISEDEFNAKKKQLLGL